MVYAGKECRMCHNGQYVQKKSEDDTTAGSILYVGEKCEEYDGV